MLKSMMRMLQPMMLLLGLAVTPLQAVAPIDRQVLVTRHNICWNDAAGRVALGNGEFCFGADGTGLQTFSGNSMAHWGWHSFPLPNGVTTDMVPATGAFEQRNIDGKLKGAINSWMFDNPHNMNLGRLRLMRANGRNLAPGDIKGLRRTLDLWTGVQTSKYQIDGSDVTVETCVHPQLDMVAVRIESPLVASGDLEVVLEFAYPNLDKGGPWVGDFKRTEGHVTTIISKQSQRLDLERRVDSTIYHVSLAGAAGCVIAQAEGKSHTYKVSARGEKMLAFACGFASKPLAAMPSFDETRRACAQRWESFWKHGGAIDLSGSKDPRWKELERRIVLSQYQMAAQSAGSWPPAEIGLLGLDDWRGQFHMEMLWWHLAHYALWDRWEMGDKALGCYRQFTPTARELATQLGSKGLKWGKECGPEGRSAPWAGNHALLWKQPHPVFFAELEYRLKPTRATLEKWAGIVQGTAEQMADCPKRDARTGIYSLDPAMPPSEQGVTKNDVFDLAYWRWALDTAQHWRVRMGMPRDSHWDEVRANLTPLPVVDGLFVHSTEWTDTYTKRNFEHPDPIGVFGMLPPTPGVDAAIATRTVARVWATWDWNRCWGWDLPWMAMAAARTGQPQIAVDALLKKSARNDYDFQGINTGGPCPYLPGNGGLLYAVAMMAAGWDGAPQRNAPGFPDDGTWVVKWEGLKTAP
jgi:hypothetical protein